MLRFLALSAAFASPALADVPGVATDVPPVHSLVARVMDGIGTPELIVPPTASPHDFALRPSDAGLLEEADLVIWIGPELSPAVTRAIEALSEAEILTLLDVAQTQVLGFRENAIFEEHDHDHEHDHDDEHDHDGRDPHAWLDPENAVIWLPEIARVLGRADPQNADAYLENARQAAADIQAQQTEISGRMAGLAQQPFIVFHDAYHYFEARFDVEATGAIALGDAEVPGPRRLAEIEAAVRDQGIRCAFAEPQFNTNLVDVAFAGAGARIEVIDPLGSMLQPGPDLYQEMLDGIATSFEACLGAE